MRGGRSKKQLSTPTLKPSDAFSNVSGTVTFIFIMSGVLSVLALTGAFYMLQIYDRALTSQSVPTLLALSMLAIGLYLIHGLLDISRSQILVRLGAQFDAKLAPLAHRVTIDMPRFGFSVAEAKERGRDIDTVRTFLSGQGPHALFDLPWMPLYIAFVYFLHPWLGALAIIGAVILASLTLISEFLMRNKASATHRAEIERANIADSHTKNSEVIRALGMVERAEARFREANNEHLLLQTKTNDVTGSFGGTSKVLRMVLQSAVLGLGAYLTIMGELTAGAIIAASVAAARAMAPIDLAIGQWKGIVSARRSYNRLKETLEAIENHDATIPLEAPTKSLSVERITVAAPGTGTVVLSDVEFRVEAGQAVGIIGASGGGKSTLARALIGVWPLVRGNVRLDGADLSQWDPERLGEHIGYVPQDVALLDTTVSDNICRLDPEPDAAKIIAAARAADIHELIVRLPEGYQTQLGPQGVSLSHGQRQRIALARALYNNPFLVVLDEPNSNLDHEGDRALTKAIEGVKERGGIAIVVAHRPSAIAACDLVGIIKDGRLVAFGEKDDILGEAPPVVKTPKRQNVHPRYVPAAAAAAGGGSSRPTPPAA